MKQLIEIDRVEDRLTVANILFKNGYTIRELTVKGEKSKVKKFIEYYKENQAVKTEEPATSEILDSKA